MRCCTMISTWIARSLECRTRWDAIGAAALASVCKQGSRIERFRAQEESWDQIIEFATRTGGKNLGFEQ